MESTVVATPGIKRITSKGVLAVDGEKGLYVSEWQKKGTKTAQLRQTVTTTSEYPSAKVSNNMNDNIFEESEFGFDAQVFESIQNRVAWINVPEALTIKEVEERLAKFPGATLYRVLDNRPILTDDQNYAIGAGLRTMDNFAASQVVRYPEDHETMPNMIIADKAGKIQYKAVFFSNTPKEDTDNRIADLAYGYASEELKAEFAAQGSDATIVANQSL